MNQAIVSREAISGGVAPPQAPDTCGGAAPCQSSSDSEGAAPAPPEALNERSMLEILRAGRQKRSSSSTGEAPALQPVKRRPSSHAYKLRSRVMQGTVDKSAGNLEGLDLDFSPHTGKVVSRRVSQASKARYPGSALERWNNAAKEARASMHCKGFVAMGGQSDAGQQLLNTTNAFKRMRSAHG